MIVKWLSKSNGKDSESATRVVLQNYYFYMTVNIIDMLKISKLNFGKHIYYFPYCEIMPKRLKYIPPYSTHQMIDSNKYHPQILMKRIWEMNDVIVIQDNVRYIPIFSNDIVNICYILARKTSLVCRNRLLFHLHKLFYRLEMLPDQDWHPWRSSITSLLLFIEYTEKTRTTAQTM